MKITESKWVKEKMNKYVNLEVLRENDKEVPLHFNSVLKALWNHSVLKEFEGNIEKETILKREVTLVKFHCSYVL